jgi:hypothetical protein
MTVLKSTYARRLVALGGIAAGLSACAESPTGVPNEPSGRVADARGDAASQQICYLIDGQRYCVGNTFAARDSSTDRP